MSSLDWQILWVGILLVSLVAVPVALLIILLYRLMRAPKPTYGSRNYRRHHYWDPDLFPPTPRKPR